MFTVARQKPNTPKIAASLVFAFAMGVIASTVLHHAVTDASALAPELTAAEVDSWASADDVLAMLNADNAADIELVAAALFDLGHVEALLAANDAESAGDVLEVLYHPALMDALADGDETRRGMWNAAADAAEALFEPEA